MPFLISCATIFPQEVSKLSNCSLFSYKLPKILTQGDDSLQTHFKCQLDIFCRTFYVTLSKKFTDVSSSAVVTIIVIMLHFPIYVYQKLRC